MSTTDVIDTLAGIAPGSALDELRARRPESRTHAQGSYDALFAPADASHASVAERAAIATFVASLHRQESAVAHYRALLEGEVASIRRATSRAVPGNSCIRPTAPAEERMAGWNSDSVRMMANT